MKIISIDLSTHICGLVKWEQRPGFEAEILRSTILIDLSNGKKFQLLDLDMIKYAVDLLDDHIKEFDPDKILIEFAMIKAVPKYLAWCSAIIAALSTKYSNRVIAINEAKWLPLADKTFNIKRKSFKDGRSGNKEWLAAIAHSLAPNYKFCRQDDIDAYVMLKTYLLNKERF